MTPDGIAKWIICGAKHLYRESLLKAASLVSNPFEQAELLYAAFNL